MNIAFSAVLLFMLLLPGLLFRYTYQRGFFRRSPITLPSFSEDLGFSILVATLFHAIWLQLFATFELRVDYGSLLSLLVGQFGLDGVFLDRSITLLETQHAAITTYFLSLYTLSYLAGYGIHYLVRRWSLDRWELRGRNRPFRFSNEWYYLFSGEDAIVAQGRLKPEVYISVVVEFKEATYIYWGVLSSWFFDRQGNLERLHLTDVYRRELTADRNLNQPQTPPANDPRYYPVKGDIFVLRANEIKTLNVEYVYVLPVN